MSVFFFHQCHRPSQTPKILQKNINWSLCNKKRKKSANCGIDENLAIWGGSVTLVEKKIMNFFLRFSGKISFCDIEILKDVLF